MDAEIRLKKAEGADYPFLWHLHVLLEKPDIERTWGWDEAWQRESFRSFIESGSWQIVQSGDERIGAIAVAEEPDAVSLIYLMLLPAFQGCGIGTRLMRDVITAAAEKCLPLRLHVLKVNLRAQRFYCGLGFKVVGDLDGRHIMELRACT